MRFVASCLTVLGAACSFAQTATVECVTFWDSPKKVYAPVREVASALKWSVGWREEHSAIFLNDKKVEKNNVRTLFDGTNLVELSILAAHGAEMGEKKKNGFLAVGGQEAEFMIPVKGIEVSIADQELRAWQGSRLVLRTNISSGKGGSTPRGEYKIGPAKRRMHYSSLYNNSPMPFAMQVHGNIFIHGYKSVPKYAASHGCIRMPLKGKNPAKLLFEWADLGTPVAIRREWSEEARQFDETSDAEARK